ncbi:MAG: ABC transporter permease, partial [Candidatus Aminicenantes bacterium]|nr:ABC transporter permease [Candidatus Aminicenantes bacterium]
MRTGKWLLRFLLPYGEQEALLGDFDEIVKEKTEQKGKLVGGIWGWGQILLLFPSFLKESLLWSIEMIRNNLKIAFRNLIRHKGFSFINIFGLAVGMVCTMLILFWVQHELSFDRFNANGRNIYRILQHIQYSEVVTWAINQGPLGPALKEEIPEIEEQARFIFSGFRIKHQNKFYVENGGFADPSFFRMFTLPFVQGSPDTALSDSRSAVITEKMALKLFGSEDPMGKVLNVLDRFDFVVTGVMKDIPDNSHFRFQFLVNMDFGKEVGLTIDSWKNSQFTTYVQLAEGASMEQVNDKIYNFLDAKPTLEDWEKLSLQPLYDIHLSSGIGYDA